jgi:hypothetical protein
MTRAPYFSVIFGFRGIRSRSRQGAVRFSGCALCPPTQTVVPPDLPQLHPSLISAQPLGPRRPLQTPTSPAHGVWPPPATGWRRGSLPDVQMIVFHQQRSSFLSCPPLHPSRTHANFEPRSLEASKSSGTRDTPLLSHCMCFLHRKFCHSAVGKVLTSKQ